jgi:hypothetical protein
MRKDLEAVDLDMFRGRTTIQILYFRYWGKPRDTKVWIDGEKLESIQVLSEE